MESRTGYRGTARIGIPPHLKILPILPQMLREGGASSFLRWNRQPCGYCRFLHRYFMNVIFLVAVNVSASVLAEIL